MSNRLIHEKSPYLQQHAHNPVDWYPWGEEAFDAARRLNKPVFLSVGYATCHWCHVMERESFEDEEAAAVLNESFICIKVDREERPDIDAVYMAACQMLTGSGGWPLSVLLTSDKKPFFAATYIPKHSRFGRLGLIDLCRRVTGLMQTEPERALESAETIANHLLEAFHFEKEPGARPDAALLTRTARQIAARYDTRNGGFDEAPKFPMPHRLSFLLNQVERGEDEGLLDKVAHTLTAMRLGGIWDHVGFGFHRYSTDREWLLPHFEKMLYDQALLTSVYLQAFRLTANPLFEQTAREILAYVLREMTSGQGGFFAAQDADSEGEEGKFYIWSLDEFQRVSSGGSQPGIDWQRIFNLQADGNFLDEATRRKTGANILHLTRPLEDWAQQLGRDPGDLRRQWEDLRLRLFQARAERIAPLTDDKILTDWNGLMIAAFAQAAVELRDAVYADAAVRAAVFIFDSMRDRQGRLLHRHRQGESAIEATANDYAFLIMGLLELYKAVEDAVWLERAVSLQETMNELFWDPAADGFFLTSAASAKELPARPKELYDGAVPSANAVALDNLVRLANLTADRRWMGKAEQLIEAFAGSIRHQPMAHTHTLNGWSLALRYQGPAWNR